MRRQKLDPPFPEYSDGPIHWGSISERIKELRNEIIRHELLYCVENNPEISDAKYDELFAE